MAGKVTIRELLVKLGVVADGKGLKTFDSNLSKVKVGMQGALKIAAAVGIAFTGLAVGAIALVDSAATGLDDVAKAAQRVGLGVEAWQEYKKAVELSGAEIEDFEVGLRRMARALDDARTLGGSMALAFERLLGPDALQQLEGLGVDETFLLLADALSKVEDEMTKSALASQVFGRGGAKLLPLINQGADGINELRQQARDLGIVLSEDATKGAEEFKDRLADATDAIGGLKTSIGVALMPVLTDLLTRFREWFIANRAIIQQRIEVWTGRLTAAMKLLDRAASEVQRRMEDIGSLGFSGTIIAATIAVAGFGAAFLLMLPTLISIGQGLAAIVALMGFLTLPALIVGVVLLGTAIAVVALAVDDFNTHLKGGTSLTGEFLRMWEEGEGIFGEVQRTMALLNLTFNQTDQLLRDLGINLTGVTNVTGVFAATWDIARLVLQGVAFQLGSINGALVVMIRSIQVGRFIWAEWDTILASIEQRLRNIGSFDFGPALTGPNFIPSFAGGGGGGGGNTNTVTQGGDTFNITTAANLDEVEEMIRRRSQEKSRAASAALTGGEV